MKKSNSSKRNRFLVCFQPVVMEEEDRTMKSSKSEKNFESMVSEKVNKTISNRMRKVKSARNLLSKVAKAVFLDTNSL
ncbi:hypothetical protein MKW94_028678, partial [Papaver nudicaule]|nr:hypothetical protein [Papaver nudicaule]MCL7024901.1 hypothetical protein [Papaver nudicaule]